MLKPGMVDRNQDPSRIWHEIRALQRRLDALVVTASGATEAYVDAGDAAVTSAAAADATTKANAAQSAAIAAAATDATAKANAAESDANTYTDSAVSGLASSASVTSGDSVTLTSANAYTDSAVTGLATEAYADTAESDAITAAQTYTDSAISGLATSASVTAGDSATLSSANAYTDTKVSGLATTAYVDTAEADAVASAATDATTKANAAQSAAQAYADTGDLDTLTDAQAYTDTAETNAITTASADATTKANAAQSAAQSYADGLVVWEVSATAPADTTKLWFHTTDKCLYYYDTTQSLWLGAEEKELMFALASVASGAGHYPGIGQASGASDSTNDGGLPAPCDLRLVGIEFRNRTLTSGWRFRVEVSSTGTNPTSSFSAADVTPTGSYKNFSHDFSPQANVTHGEGIGIAVTGGTTALAAEVILLRYRRRPT